MAATGERIRSLEKVILKDLVFPSRGGLPMVDEGMMDVRHQAIAEVLCRIPEDSYQKLLSLADTFNWFIPDKGTLAKCYRFWNVLADDPPFARVLYLNPVLEELAFGSAVAVVAHELAHIILGHNLRVTPEEYEAKELAAGKLVTEWGFEQEVSRRQGSEQKR
jgi:hypothetical protein